MSAAHTPTPWRVVGREPTRENVRFGYWDVEGKSNVATSCTYLDACLIVHAVNCHDELLKALEAMVADFGGFTDYEDLIPGSIADAHAAIAKALGRTPNEIGGGCE